MGGSSATSRVIGCSPSPSVLLRPIGVRPPQPRPAPPSLRAPARTGPGSWGNTAELLNRTAASLQPPLWPPRSSADSCEEPSGASRASNRGETHEEAEKGAVGDRQGDIHLPMPSVLITIPLRVAGSQKFKLHVFWKREGNLCVGDKKKSPNSNHAHRTTSHKTEHHWEKMGSHGGDLDCRGGGRHLRKRSLLNGNQMGYVLLNRIPDSQRWAGAAWPRSALPRPPPGHGPRRLRGAVAGPGAATEWLLDPRLLAPRPCSAQPATPSPSPLPESPN